MRGLQYLLRIMEQPKHRQCPLLLTKRQSRLFPWEEGKQNKLRLSDWGHKKRRNKFSFKWSMSTHLFWAESGKMVWSCLSEEEKLLQFRKLTNRHFRIWPVTTRWFSRQQPYFLQNHQKRKQLASFTIMSQVHHNKFKMRAFLKTKINHLQVKSFSLL